VFITETEAAALEDIIRAHKKEKEGERPAPPSGYLSTGAIAGNILVAYRDRTRFLKNGYKNWS